MVLKMNTEEEYIRLKVILEQIRYLKRLDDKYTDLERHIEDNYYRK